MVPVCFLTNNKMPAKKAAKKAARKTAKKAPLALGYAGNSDAGLAAAPVCPGEIDWEAEDAPNDEVREDIDKGLTKLINQAKSKPIGWTRPGMMRHHYAPMHPLALQYLFECRGVVTHKVVDVVGEQGAGKTTLLFALAAEFAKQGCHVIYVDCEEKRPSEKRIKQLLHPNRKVAGRLLRQITVVSATQTQEADHAVEKAATEIRAATENHALFGGRPIVAMYDTWSTLKPPQEAAGREDWGVTAATKKKEKRQEVGGSANFGLSKHGHAFKRWFPGAARNLNLICVMARHQNVKLPDMSGPPQPSFMQSEKDNDTATGGRGISDIAYMRLTVTGSRQVKDPKSRQVLGQLSTIKCIKHSFGVGGREIQMMIHKNNQHLETPEVQAPAVSFAEGLCKALLNSGVLDLTLRDGLYTVPALDLKDATAVQVEQALSANKELTDIVGHRLGIEGYENPETDDQESQRPPED